MPSFDDLKKKLNNGSESKDDSELASSEKAIIKVSKKDKNLIEVEDDTLEGAILEACSYFNTHKNNLKMKITQKGAKGVFGVGKKRYKVLFKYYGDNSVKGKSDEPMDGYLKIHVRKDGVYVKVTQGVNGGKEISEDYVTKNLVERKIREYDKSEIKKSIAEKQNQWVKVSGPVKTNPEWNSKAKIDVSKDKMEVKMTMTPPILNGRIVEKDTIMELLKTYNVKSGIIEDRIDEAIEECLYNKSIVIAEGKTPKHGDDAYMDFKFKTHPERDLDLKEDQFGKVDYFNVLGLIVNVVEDQVLAVKVPPTKGEPGKNVHGEVIEAKNGEDIELPLGKNTKASDNGMEVISMIQGQALYENGLISVEPVYTVNGNVDLSTGKIVFLGTVIVKGDVEDGFGVKATQNIEIGGTVGRCEIEAEGNVLIKGGIQGKSSVSHHTNNQPENPDEEPEGYVKAGKNIYAKFINGSVVEADNDVIVSDAIYHSKVTSGNRIVCLGKKGRVIGGILVASKEVNAKEVGSRNSSTLTEIEVGTDPEAKRKLLSFDYELKEKEEQAKKMRQHIEQLNKQREQNKGYLPPDKEVMLQKFLLASKEYDGIIDEIKEDIADLRSYLDDIKTSGKISIKDYVYPGVHIQIKEIRKAIDKENQYVTYILEGGDIRDIQYQELSKEAKEEISKDAPKEKRRR